MHPTLPLFVTAVICTVSVSPSYGDEPGGRFAEEITKALTADQGVKADKINVRSTSGIVTLSGEVDSFLQKRRAGAIVKQSNAVRSLINDIRVKPGPKSDAMIKEHVEAALLYNNEIVPQRVEVGVEDGVVTLSGTAFGWAHRNKAEREAGAVSGVIEVVNQLEVKWDVERSDKAIREHIENLYRHDIRLLGSRITVSVNEGKVVLAGKVESLEKRDLAYDLAWVTAVTSVESGGLAVATHHSASSDDRTVDDASIAKTIGMALNVDTRVDSAQVTAQSEDGAVTLAGQVPNLLSKEAAEQVARDTIGVTDVRNDLMVKAEGERDDEAIRDAIVAAFQRHPDIEAYEITVRVSNGAVTLSGEVHSQYDLLQARTVAAAAAGVDEVTNHLDVATSL